MDHQFFFSIFFLFILTINYSLTLSYFDRTNGIIKTQNIFLLIFYLFIFLDISKDNLDQSDENVNILKNLFI